MNIHRILYDGLIANRNPQRNVAGFAEFTGVSESLIYKIVHGVTVPTSDILTAYYRYTGDDEILYAMLEGTDRFPAPRPKTGSKVRAISHEAMECGAAVGKLHAHVAQSMEDKRITDQEKRRANRIVDEIQREAEEVRLSIVLK